MTSTIDKMSSLASLIVPVGFIIMWEAAVRANLLPPSQSAAPSTVAVRLGELMASGVLLPHVLYSLLRLMLGAFFGAGLGICSGVILAHSRWAERLLSPTMQFLAPIPAIVWIPFSIMVFGLGEFSKIALVAMGLLFLLHMNTFQGIRATHRDYVELAEIYEKSPWQKIWHVLLPSAMPSILTGLRIGLAFGWIILFVAEYADSRQGAGGLGWFIADSRGFGRVEEQFAGILVLGALGFVSDWLVAMVQKRTLAWHESNVS